MPEPTTAENLFQNAQSYVAAAARLMEADEIDTALAPAFYLLIGFAIELLLKAVCLRDGATQKQIRSFSHDLRKAYLRAIDAGKVPRYMTPFGRLVLELDQHHRTHSFRYTPDGELGVPPPAHCVRVLDEQIAIVSADWGATVQ